MKKFYQEFKEFAIKGNMIDIAIGVIIGNAFNKVVNVLVKEVFLPPLTLITNGVNWENKRFVLREAIVHANGVTEAEVAMGYGKLVEVTIDFLVIGLTVFLVVKVMNRLKNKAEDAQDKTVTTPKNIELLNKMTVLMEEQNKLLQGKT